MKTNSISKIWYLITIILAFIFLNISFCKKEEIKVRTIIIKGDDTLIPCIIDIADRFEKRYKDKNVKIKVIGGGSSRAIGAIIDGDESADIAITTRNLNNDEKSMILKLYRQSNRDNIDERFSSLDLELESVIDKVIDIKKIARDEILFVVNKDNNIPYLHRRDIVKIFSNDILMKWSDIYPNTSLEREDNHIVPVTRETNTGIYFTVFQKIFNGWNVGLRADEQISDMDVVKKILTTKGAIGYIYKSFYKEGLRVIPILGLQNMSYYNDSNDKPKKIDKDKEEKVSIYSEYDKLSNLYMAREIELEILNENRKDDLTKAKQYEQDDIDNNFYPFSDNPLLTDFYLIIHKNKEEDKMLQNFISFIYSDRSIKMIKNAGFGVYDIDGKLVK